MLNLYDVVKVHGLFQRILFGLAVFTNWLINGLFCGLRKNVIEALLIWRISFDRWNWGRWLYWLQRLQGLVGLLFLKVTHSRNVLGNKRLRFDKNSLIIELKHLLVVLMRHLLHFLQVFLLLRSSNLHSLNLKHWLKVQPGHNWRLFAWLVDSKER